MQKICEQKKTKANVRAHHAPLPNRYLGCCVVALRGGPKNLLTSPFTMSTGGPAFENACVVSWVDANAKELFSCLLYWRQSCHRRGTAKISSSSCGGRSFAAAGIFSWIAPCLQQFIFSFGNPRAPQSGHLFDNLPTSTGPVCYVLMGATT